MESIINSFANIFEKVLPKLPSALMAFIISYLFLWLIRRIIRGSLVVARTPKALTQMIMSIINVLAWVIVVALVLQSVGLNQIAFALTGSVAILGLIMASGVNAAIADIISGLFLVKDPDFNVGGKVKSADVEGVIEKIDLRKTRVRDNGGKLHIIPNSVFDKAQWIVLDEENK